MKVPTYLYKYRSFSDKRHVNAAIGNQLWFSIGEKFNDPFDCTPDIPMILGNGESIRRWAEEKYLGFESLTNAMGSKNAALNHIFESIQRNGERTLSPIIDGIAERVSRSFVHCLSATATNQLLWSNYGDYHKGFCLRYRTDKLLENAPLEFHGMVSYDNDPINVMDFMMSDDMLAGSRAFVLKVE